MSEAKKSVDSSEDARPSKPAPVLPSLNDNGEGSEASAAGEKTATESSECTGPPEDAASKVDSMAVGAAEEKSNPLEAAAGEKAGSLEEAAARNEPERSEVLSRDDEDHNEKAAGSSEATDGGVPVVAMDAAESASISGEELSGTAAERRTESIELPMALDQVLSWLHLRRVKRRRWVLFLLRQ